MKANENIRDTLGKQLHSAEVGALQSLLTGEISAVEAYNLAMQKVRNTDLMPTLERCRNSHAVSVKKLRDRMEDMGEEPPAGAGLWGAVANLAESSAALMGDRVAMSVLAAGEDYGLRQYEQRCKDLDNDTWEVVQEELIPAQEKTMQTMSLLCAMLKEEGEEGSESGAEPTDRRGS